MPVRFLVFMLTMSALMWLVDLYVLRRWKKYASVRPRLRRTILPLTVLLWAMPLVMPTYAATSRWWDGGPLRGIVVGLWAFHYVPRTMIAAWLVGVDVLRAARWIWKRTERRTAPPEVVTAESVLAEAVAERSPGAAARPSRREMLRTTGWALAGVPFVAVGTGLFKTVYDFEVRRVRVPIAGLPRGLAGLRIAQVSDLHAGSFFTPAPVDEAVRLLLAERADLALFTGDFVNHDAAELAPLLPLLRRLRADLGVFGILGNHDHYAHVPDVLAALTTTPVQMLVNARHTVRIDGADLHLLGTDNTGFGQHHADLPRTLAGLGAPGERDELRLMMTHDPTFWDRGPRDAGVALTLSGHTHGGQIGWEWAQADGMPWGVNLADLRYDRTAGLYEEASAFGPARLYINRGLGTTGPPLRLGVRPEITVLELVAA